MKSRARVNSKRIQRKEGGGEEEKNCDLKFKKERDFLYFLSLRRGYERQKSRKRDSGADTGEI